MFRLLPDKKKCKDCTKCENELMPEMIILCVNHVRGESLLFLTSAFNLHSLMMDTLRKDGIVNMSPVWDKEKI